MTTSLPRDPSSQYCPLGVRFQQMLTHPNGETLALSGTPGVGPALSPQLGG